LSAKALGVSGYSRSRLTALCRSALSAFISGKNYFLLKAALLCKLLHLFCNVVT